MVIRIVNRNTIEKELIEDIEPLMSMLSKYSVFVRNRSEHHITPAYNFKFIDSIEVYKTHINKKCKTKSRNIIKADTQANVLTLLNMILNSNNDIMKYKIKSFKITQNKTKVFSPIIDKRGKYRRNYIYKTNYGDFNTMVDALIEYNNIHNTNYKIYWMSRKFKDETNPNFIRIKRGKKDGKILNK